MNGRDLALLSAAGLAGLAAAWRGARGSRGEAAERGRVWIQTPSRSKKLVHIVSRKDLARIWRDREGGASGDLVAWVEISVAGPPYREGIPMSWTG